MSANRVQQAPAWLLHHRPFRDSSRILDIFSRDHGRLALVARGARKAGSRLKGVLRPFLPLNLSWSGRGELPTLTGAELSGSPLTLTGDGLLSGYYVNELLLRLTHRHDAQPELFALYGEVIGGLAAAAEPAVILRRFEMELLGLLGYGLDLEHDTRDRAALEEAASYEYRAGQGAVPVERRQGAMVFSGRELIAIREQRFDEAGVRRAAGRLLRGVIAFHLDGRELKSRKVLHELRRGAAGRGPTSRTTDKDNRH